eukprot:9057356-Pyramimonas_sp.AAC.1
MRLSQLIQTTSFVNHSYPVSDICWSWLQLRYVLGILATCRDGVTTVGILATCRDSATTGAPVGAARHRVLPPVGAGAG